ncbi:MAG: fluoride efflux transporter CrcB [Phycisphaerae bacterium]
MVLKLIYLGLAGAAGALARYALAGVVQRFTNGAFPWGTLVVNLLGCFLFGLIWALAEDRFLISSQTRIILLVGFMGAFTTFSSFAFETTQMLRDSEWLWAGFNIAFQNLIGILFLVVGMRVGRLF